MISVSLPDTSDSDAGHKSCRELMLESPQTQLSASSDEQNSTEIDLLLGLPRTEETLDTVNHDAETDASEAL